MSSQSGTWVLAMICGNIFLSSYRMLVRTFMTSRVSLCISTYPSLHTRTTRVQCTRQMIRWPTKGFNYIDLGYHLTSDFANKGATKLQFKNAEHSVASSWPNFCNELSTTYSLARFCTIRRYEDGIKPHSLYKHAFGCAPHLLMNCASKGCATNKRV